MRTVEVTEELQAYLDGLVPPRDSVLARMEEEAERESIPIVDAHEGAFLSLLMKIARAKRVLELALDAVIEDSRPGTGARSSSASRRAGRWSRQRAARSSVWRRSSAASPPLSGSLCSA